jgi:hypothetical protein
MAWKIMKEFNATYGRGTPCRCYLYNDWYAIEGSTNVNHSRDVLLAVFDAHENGGRVDVEVLNDASTFTWPGGIHSLDDLIEAVED